jgi:hypothetical protein
MTVDKSATTDEVDETTAEKKAMAEKMVTIEKKAMDEKTAGEATDEKTTFEPTTVGVAMDKMVAGDAMDDDSDRVVAQAQTVGT